MVFYFTSTGNSLYVARQLDAEVRSIPQEMKKDERHYKADKIGIICPIFELDLPDYVKEPNPNARYRNPNITLAELIQANRQN